MIKLYYMHYGFVALYLNFVCVKADCFPYIKGINEVYTMEFSIMTWFRQPMSHSPKSS